MGFSAHKRGKLYRQQRMGWVYKPVRISSLLNPGTTGGNKERNQHWVTITLSLTHTRRTTSHKHNTSTCYPESPQRMRAREERHLHLFGDYRQLASSLLDMHDPQQSSGYVDH
jgi:hypothetical protein